MNGALDYDSQSVDILKAIAANPRDVLNSLDEKVKDHLLGNSEYWQDIHVQSLSQPTLVHDSERNLWFGTVSIVLAVKRRIPGPFEEQQEEQESQ